MSDSRGRTGRKLPWTYYYVFVCALLLVMVVGAAIAVSLGWNPYIAALVVGGAYVVREVWTLKRSGF